MISSNKFFTVVKCVVLVRSRALFGTRENVSHPLLSSIVCFVTPIRLLQARTTYHRSRSLLCSHSLCDMQIIFQMRVFSCLSLSFGLVCLFRFIRSLRGSSGRVCLLASVSSQLVLSPLLHVQLCDQHLYELHLANILIEVVEKGLHH